VLVVHSEDGLDEISIAGPSRVAELKDGTVTTYRIEPEQFGIERQSLDAVVVKSPQESLALIREAFAGTPGPALDMLVLNAGAAIYAARVSETLAAGVARARETIAAGKAQRTLKDFVEATR